MRRKSLYKYVTVALISTMFISLSACGNTDKAPVAESEETEISTESSQPEENLAESESDENAISESKVTKETLDNTEEAENIKAENDESLNSGETLEEESDNTDLQESFEDEDLEFRDFEEPFGDEISVDATTLKKMNIFLSNFSEAGLQNFDKDDYDLRRLFAWGFIWTKLNKWKNITYENRPEEGIYSVCEVISLNDINKIFDKYLGFEITDEEATAQVSERDDYFGLFYEDGGIKAPAADGESYTGLSIVNKIEDLGDNRLKLYFTNYSQDLDAYFEGTDKDVYYGLTAEEAANNPELEQIDLGYAVVSVEESSYKLEHLEIK